MITSQAVSILPGRRHSTEHMEYGPLIYSPPSPAASCDPKWPCVTEWEESWKFVNQKEFLNMQWPKFNSEPKCVMNPKCFTLAFTHIGLCNFTQRSSEHMTHTFCSAHAITSCNVNRHCLTYFSRDPDFCVYITVSLLYQVFCSFGNIINLMKKNKDF